MPVQLEKVHVYMDNKNSQQGETTGDQAKIHLADDNDRYTYLQPWQKLSIRTTQSRDQPADIAWGR